MDKIVIKCFTR